MARLSWMAASVGLLGFEEDAGEADTCLFEFWATLDERLKLLAGLFEVAQVALNLGQFVGCVAVSRIDGELGAELVRGLVAIFGVVQLLEAGEVDAAHAVMDSRPLGFEAQDAFKAV